MYTTLQLNFSFKRASDISRLTRVTSLLILAGVSPRSVPQPVCSSVTRGLRPVGFPCPQTSPGKNTQVGCQFLLQGNFPAQGSNPHLLHRQADSLPTRDQTWAPDWECRVFAREPPGKSLTFIQVDTSN